MFTRHPAVLLVAMAAALGIPAAQADQTGHPLTMTLSFAITAPTDSEARQVMEDMLAVVASTYQHLEPAVGEIWVGGVAGGPVEARGDIILTGNPTSLLAVEEEYGGLAESVYIRGENIFGVTAAVSMHDFGPRAKALLVAASILAAAGSTIVVLLIRTKAAAKVVIFTGTLYGFGSFFAVLGYLTVITYALP